MSPYDRETIIQILKLIPVSIVIPAIQWSYKKYRGWKLRKPEALIALGTQKYKIGMYQEALDHFNEALEHDPSNITAWMEKSNVLAILGRKKESSLAFSRVLAIEMKKAKAVREGPAKE